MSERLLISRQVRRNGKVYTYFYDYQGNYIKKNSRKKLSELPFSRLNQQACLERDKFTCQMCGRMDSLLVHHKDGKGPHKVHRAVDNSLDNLLTLCGRCHMVIHYGVTDKRIDIAARIDQGESLISIARFHSISRQRIYQIKKAIEELKNEKAVATETTA